MSARNGDLLVTLGGSSAFRVGAHNPGVPLHRQTRAHDAHALHVYQQLFLGDVIVVQKELGGGPHVLRVVQREGQHIVEIHGARAVLLCYL